MNDTVIQVERVSKEYRLGAIGGTTLREDLQRLGAKLFRKEDPTACVELKSGNYGKKFLALNDVSFSVRKGEAVGIIGHNGAGKSTLLKLLSRVTAPTEGKISYNGRIASMLEVGTGFHPELTGRENVYMNGAILGMTKAEIDKKFDEIVEFAEMAQFIDTPVKRYSSGMYVKLAFAVAAHLDSEIMIMDEVLAVGDMKFQQKCLGRMGDAANNEGRTVLYVSHNMNTIRQLCDRCIVLNHGKVELDGSVAEGIKRYMETNDATIKPFYDLTETKRPHLIHGVKTRLTGWEFEDTDSCVYDRKMPMHIRIDWDANEDLEDLRFLLEVRALDGTNVAAMESEIVGSCKKGEKHTTRLDVDVSALAEGKYYFVVDMYTVNEVGAHQSYDHPTQKFYFEIINQEPYSIIWQPQHWGYSRMKRMKVIEDTHKY